MRARTLACVWGVKMSSVRIPGSLRRPIGKPASASGAAKKDASVTTLVTAACLAAASPATIALAQTTPLPPLSVEAKQQKMKATPAPAKKSGGAVAAPAPAVQAAPAITIPAPNARGDIGYNATRTSMATKTDTPLLNVPQSVSVVTQEQIKDQSFQSISDITRYVSGIIIHQGEGNRDQVSIRGQVASTADFFLNGVRDDGQIFRDLYNADRVEILKGPTALIFGRGGAGGIVNRVTKEADFRTFQEATVEYGSFDHKRAVVDVDQRLSSTAAFRITGMLENSGSYRDDVELSRWAINPTLAFRPSDNTGIVLSYEHAEDRRTADRGVPSVRPPGSLLGYPSTTDPSRFFGNPGASFAHGEVDRAYARVEHKTDFGLTIRNTSLWAQYDRMYQNVYAGGPYNLTTGLVPLVAYNNINNRENLFNQTDLIYKFDAGWTRHTLLVGAEFGIQYSDNFRRNGGFDSLGQCAALGPGNGLPNGTCFVPFANANILSPTVSFVTPQTKNHTEVNVQSFYIQDQIQITRYLELIAGVRHETFDLTYENLLPPTPAAPATLGRTDRLVSPRAGVILKPTDYFSIYGTYSISYLPASGDQFASVAANTVNLEPEKYTNYEVGVKWDVTKALAFTAATYRVDRENVRFAQANGTFVQTGESRVEGHEITLTGYVTNRWQVSGGWSHNHGELTSATSPTLVAGTPLPLLPSDTVSLWNRYQITSNWAAGVGVVYHTEMFASLQPFNNLVVLPSFTTVDAAVYWKINEHWKAQLNVTNLFNERYILSADNNDNLSPGAPTTVVLSMTSRF
jgi:catecholate siderophore receptor